MAEKNTEVKIVEIEGKKYQADEKGEALKDEKGNLVPFEEQKPPEDSNLVKHLRTTIDAKDAEIEKLKKAQTDTTGMTATEVQALAENVKRLTFENNIARKLPQYADKADELYEIQKKFPTATFEEVVAQFVGKSVIDSQEKGTQGHSLKTKPISITAPGEPKLEEKSDKELLEIAKKEFVV